MLTQPFIKGLDGSIQSETFVNRNMITDIVHICLKDSEDSLLGFCRVVSTDTTGVVSVEVFPQVSGICPSSRRTVCT